MTDNGTNKLAVLIDAFNAQAAICGELLAEIAKFGIASVKRACRHWTASISKDGKKHLLKTINQSYPGFNIAAGDTVLSHG